MMELSKSNMRKVKTPRLLSKPPFLLMTFL
jgi:hypothetical protein